MDVKEMVQEIAKTCDDKLAKNIVALDMHRVSLVADYFLICHASNPRQVQAIAKAVKDMLDEKNIPIKHTEGFDQAKWIVVDTGYVLCHIFQEEERSFYNLERLWGDAARVPLEVGQES